MAAEERRRHEGSFNYDLLDDDGKTSFDIWS